MSRAVASHPPRSSRPGVIRVVVWTFVAVWLGGMFTALALLLPLGELTGDVPLALVSQEPIPADGAWSIAATAAGLVLAGVVCAPLVRAALTWTTDGRPATSHVVAGLLAGAIVALAVPGVSWGGGLLVGALLIWRTAYLDDGRARREPFPLGRRTATTIGLLIAAGSLAVLGLYTVRHPLRVPRGISDQPVPRGTTPTTVQGPVLENSGHRTVRIAAIRAGAERGSALRFVSARPAGRAATLTPGAVRYDVPLVVSRAGCRPGATGAIDSVRVVFASGHSQLVPLAQRPTLAC